MSKIKELIKKIDEFLEKNSKIITISLITIQFIILVGLLIYAGPYHEGDTPSYIKPAMSFIETGRMLDGDAPTLYRTPGYLLYLALMYWLTGSDYGVVIPQIFMAIAISYMVYYLVSNISKKKSLGCIAVLFIILDVSIYQHTICILTDIMFSFLLVLSLFFLYKYTVSNSYKDILFCFLSINYALAVRPQILYLNIMINVALLILVLMKKVSVKVFLTYVVLFNIIFVDWSYRNYVNIGEFSYTPIRNKDYYKYYAPYTYMQENSASLSQANEYLRGELLAKYPNYESLDGMAQINAKADIGKAYVYSHMGSFIICNFKGLFYEMCLDNMDIIESIHMSQSAKLWIGRFFEGFLVLSYLIYAYGFLKNITKHDWLDWLILIVVMYLMASTAIVGQARYRLAFYPLSIIGTFTCYRDKRKNR